VVVVDVIIGECGAPSGPLVKFTSPSPPSGPRVNWTEVAAVAVEPDGRSPGVPVYEPAVTDKTDRGGSKRQSTFHTRSPTTTFGYIAIPPRFIGSVSHGGRGRAYVSSKGEN